MDGNNFNNSNGEHNSNVVVSEQNKAGKVCSIIGFIAGIVAFLLAVCPCTFWVTELVALPAIIVCIVGLAKRGNKTFCIVGLVCSGVGWVISIVFFIVFVIKQTTFSFNLLKWLWDSGQLIIF